jgi:hypothetical protein
MRRRLGRLKIVCIIVPGLSSGLLRKMWEDEAHDLGVEHWLLVLSVSSSYVECGQDTYLIVSSRTLPLPKLSHFLWGDPMKRQ